MFLFCRQDRGRTTVYTRGTSDRDKRNPKGQDPGTSCFNSEQFEFVGQVARTIQILVSALSFVLTKMDGSHERTWSPWRTPGQVPESTRPLVYAERYALKL